MSDEKKLDAIGLQTAKILEILNGMTANGLLPLHLAQLVTVTEDETNIILKATEFLGKVDFAKLANAIKAQGGEYVSAGVNSHFTIPK